jgi:hypothetical protein
MLIRLCAMCIESLTVEITNQVLVNSFPHHSQQFWSVHEPSPHCAEFSMSTALIPARMAAGGCDPRPRALREWQLAHSAARAAANPMDLARPRGAASWRRHEPPLSIQPWRTELNRTEPCLSDDRSRGAEDERRFAGAITAVAHHFTGAAAKGRPRAANTKDRRLAANFNAQGRPRAANCCCHSGLGRASVQIQTVKVSILNP